MAKTYMVSEVLQLVEDAATREEKIAILKKFETPWLKTVLKYGFDPKFIFFTQTIPPYKPDLGDNGLAYNSLIQQYKSIGNFLVTSPIAPERKLRLLYVMFESMDSSEGKVLELVLQKKLNLINGLNIDVVNAAFPGLIPDESAAKNTKSSVAATKS